jgi:hypothetical protein
MFTMMEKSNSPLNEAVGSRSLSLGGPENKRRKSTPAKNPARCWGKTRFFLEADGSVESCPVGGIFSTYPLLLIGEIRSTAKNAIC